MVKSMKLKGSQSFRQRLVLSTLCSIPVTIEEIRSDDISPGLRPYELSFLRLLEKLSDNCLVEINETGEGLALFIKSLILSPSREALRQLSLFKIDETGTKLKYKPGVLMGRRNLVHDCGPSRSMGYFLEPLTVLGIFGKKPLSITLKGITNDSKDPSVDTFMTATFNILKRFGIPLEDKNFKIKSRGSPPLGGGVVELFIPIVEDSLKAVLWDDVGLVKSIRGFSFSTRLSVQYEQKIIHAVRGILNRLCFDIMISTDHKGNEGRDNRKVGGGNSPGYGITLVAETTTGCFISVDNAISRGKVDEEDESGEDKRIFSNAEEVGEKIVSALCGELEQGGVVDSTHQGLLFLLCALCPPDVSKVRVGKLSPYGIATLGNIKEFLGVTFAIKPDPSNETVILKCMGSGLKNLSRKLS